MGLAGVRYGVGGMTCGVGGRAFRLGVMRGVAGIGMVGGGSEVAVEFVRQRERRRGRWGTCCF